MQEKKKATHFVAKGYLKNFRTPHLWRGDLEKHLIKQVSLERAAVLFYYYTLKTINPNYRNVVEDFFANEIEDPAVAILDKVVSSSFPPELTEGQRLTLAAFMAFQKTRVPAFREMVEEFSSEVGTMSAKMLASHPEAFKRNVERFEKATGGKVEDPEAIRQEWLSETFRAVARPQVSLKLLLDVAPNLIQPISNMHWSFLLSKNGAEFLTSDNPVVWHNPNANAILRHGLATPEVEITFPLSSHLCLFCQWEPKTQSQVVSNSVVDIVNMRMITWARRHVFTPSEKLASWAVTRRQEMERSVKTQER